MYLQIKTAKLEKAQFGNNIVIEKIWLYDEAWKWKKWIKLNDASLDVLINNKIQWK